MAPLPATENTQMLIDLGISEQQTSVSCTAQRWGEIDKMCHCRRSYVRNAGAAVTRRPAQPEQRPHFCIPFLSCWETFRVKWKGLDFSRRLVGDWTTCSTYWTLLSRSDLENKIIWLLANFGTITGPVWNSCMSSMALSQNCVAKTFMAMRLNLFLGLESLLPQNELLIN